MSLIKHKNQKGFTLLEIMVTVAIVGILAAIAIPIYNNYITKVRIAEALTHGRVYAGKVTIDREDPVDPPENLEYSEIELAGSQENPRVRIMLKANIASAVLIGSDEPAGGKVIVLSEQSSDASVRWACTTNLPQALIPEGCTHEEGVGQRKLLAEWTEGNDACWSPERAAAGKSGWAVGPCSSCTQARTQQKAGQGVKRALTNRLIKAECSGQYIDDETLALIETHEAARDVEDARLAIEEEEEDRVAALPPGERAKEVAWELKVENEETDGTPWAEVPARSADTVTPCWDNRVTQASLKANGNGNGWVVGRNEIAERWSNPDDQAHLLEQGRSIATAATGAPRQVGNNAEGAGPRHVLIKDRATSIISWSQTGLGCVP